MGLYDVIQEGDVTLPYSSSSQSLFYNHNVE